jgi:hypothetical protein
VTDENTITAAILGELIPELEYAAPRLLMRLERGEPLVQTTPQTDLGFVGGPVDPVLLEFFKALVPYVKTALGCGMLGILQTWLLSKRDARHQAELIATLKAAIHEDTKRWQAFEKLAEFLARMDSAPVSADEVIESFVAASRRLSTTNDADPR